MPSYKYMKFAREQALKYAGMHIWFREVEGGSIKLGRVVGYDYALAQIVLEVTYTPDYPADPLNKNFEPVAMLAMNAGRNYVCVSVFLLDTDTPHSSPDRPHHCPRCAAPALILFRTIECSSSSCRNYRA